MASAYKILGQCFPNAKTLTALYECPAASEAIGTLFCCNTGPDEISVTIGVTLSGETPVQNKGYLCADKVVKVGEEFSIPNICLGAGDVLSVKSNYATAAFNFLGSLIS